MEPMWDFQCSHSWVWVVGEVLASDPPQFKTDFDIEYRWEIAGRKGMYDE